MAKENVPKYFVLMEWIKKQIVKGELKVGDKLLSENELGERFAISRQTVRQATSVLENEGVLERRRGSGTYVKSIRRPLKIKTMSIGVVTTYLDDYIFPGIIKGIENILTQNGYTMQLAITYNKIENEMNILSKMLEDGIDGIIVEPSKSGLPNLNSDLYRKIRCSGIPCLFINGYYPNMDYPYVAMDDYACGRDAVKYLLKYGHKKIAGIFKSDDIQGHLRYAGCAKTLQQNKILLAEENIVWFTTEDLKAELDDSFAERVMDRIKDCTAVVCYNDQIAAKIIKILAEQNMAVPDDISVISFDNSDLGVRADLTTFVHPKEELGKTAAKNLLNLMNEEDFNANCKFPPVLIERSSVKKV